LKAKKILLPTLTFLGLLVLWEAAVRIFAVPLYVLPAPSKIVQALFGDFSALMGHAWVTLGETLLGLALAILAGILLAVLMDCFPTLRGALYPLLVVSQTIPIIVLAPLFTLWLSFGLAPKVLIVVLMCFFPIAVNFADGMARVDTRLCNLVRAYGAGRVQVYVILKFPAAAQYLFSGLRVAATYSISGAVVGEWMSSGGGLGYYMLRAKNGYMLDKVFASVLMVVLLSLLMNGAVKLLQYLVLPAYRKKL